ncbi:MAG: pantetheine-phosphate adenylyltransferase [Candidatus Excrementavichristensenella sp.]
MRLIYPGSFDPPTKGHIHIARRAAALCGDLVVLVMRNPGKPLRLETEQRAALLERCLVGTPGIRVECGSGLLADEVRRLKGQAILRGLRDQGDYAAERRLADAFRAVFDIETLFMQCDASLSHISSSLVRELLGLKGPAQALVPEEIFDDVWKAYCPEGQLKGE